MGYCKDCKYFNDAMKHSNSAYCENKNLPFYDRRAKWAIMVNFGCEFSSPKKITEKEFTENLSKPELICKNIDFNATC